MIIDQQGSITDAAAALALDFPIVIQANQGVVPGPTSNEVVTILGSTGGLETNFQQDPPQLPVIE